VNWQIICIAKGEKSEASFETNTETNVFATEDIARHRLMTVVSLISDGQ
jgi:hypothetical protein